MPGHIGKLVISNLRALADKYGSQGLAEVRRALDRLAARDVAEGLSSRLVDISDADVMAALDEAAVADARDEQGAKAAVDAASAALTPVYILLLGGPDIIPHIMLRPIVGLADIDTWIPSDLPYASEAPWSDTASEILSLTRVVGRLGDPPGCRSPEGLVAMIEASTQRRPQPARAFRPPFAICAAGFAGATRLTLARVFGEAVEPYVAPEATHPEIDPGLPRLTHFINCHGGEGMADYYGDPEAGFPIAMSSRATAALAPNGCVVASQVCYGARLYDPGAGEAPLCHAYLRHGAAGYVGSTTLAYGGREATDHADLLTQAFLTQVLGGASLGRALLEARHAFIRSQPMGHPMNIKTLAQFLLLGDPSWTPCAVAEVDHGLEKGAGPGIDRQGRRQARRLALYSQGLAYGASASRPGPPIKPSPELLDALAAAGFAPDAAPEDITVLSVTGGPLSTAASAALGHVENLALRVKISADRRTVEVQTARILDNHVIALETAFSR